MAAVVNERSGIELNSSSVWLVRDYRCSTVRFYSRTGFIHSFIHS